MSEYLFGKETLAKRAAENIEKYQINRTEILKGHLESLKRALEQQVLLESRRSGKNSLEYNIGKFPLPKENSKIKIEPLTQPEMKDIMLQLLEWSEKEGLKADVPGLQFNTFYYQPTIRLSWDFPADKEPRAEVSSE